MFVLGLGYIILLFYLHYQSQARVGEIFGGNRGVALLKHADKVEAFRIGKIADTLRWPDVLLTDYPIQAGPMPVSPSDTKLLVDTLLDEKSYYWNAAKACIPQPGVRIDFSRGDQTLSILLCFECEILETYLNGKSASGQNFEYAQPTLVRIARKLFPNDPKIQSLTEEEFTPPQAK